MHQILPRKDHRPEPHVNKPSRQSIIVSFWRATKKSEDKNIHAFGEFLREGIYMKDRDMYVWPQWTLEMLQKTFREFIKTRKIEDEHGLRENLITLAAADREIGFGIFMHILDNIYKTNREINITLLQEEIRKKLPLSKEEEILEAFSDHFILQKIEERNNAKKKQ